MPLSFAGVPVQQTPGDVVVTIAEDCGGDRDGVAQSSFCGVAATVHLWLNFFDNNALPAFYRFHIHQIFNSNLPTHGIPATRTSSARTEAEGKSL